MTSSLKIFFALSFLFMSQIAAAKTWNIWELREKLSEKSHSDQRLSCTSSAGKFEITVDTAKSFMMSGVVYGGGLFGGDSVIENQPCETALHEVLCYFGTGKWIDIDLRKMYVIRAEGRIAISGSVKSSTFSEDLELLKCSLPL